MEEKTMIYIQPIENTDSSFVFSINIDAEGHMNTRLLKASPQEGETAA